MEGNHTLCTEEQTPTDQMEFLYGEGENGTHTLDGGHVQMATVDPKERLKSLLSDCTWLK